MSGVTLPSSFESVIGLGEPIRAYKSGIRANWLNLIVCAIGVVVASVTICYGLVYPQTFPKAASNALVIIAFGVLLLIGVLFWVWRIFSRWNEAVVLYRDGLAHFNGKQVRTFRWGEIASITVKIVRYSYYGIIPTGTSHNCAIASLAGEQLKLDDTIHKVGDLVDQVRRQTLPHIIARTKPAFDAGQSLQFGPISIGKAQGVQCGNKSYVWGDIAQVSMDSGELAIKPKKGGLFGGLNVSVAKIPNVDVLLAIMADMANQHMQSA